jgi:hypothetical protein
MKKFFPVFVYLSFAWNLFLVIGVVCGASYALERAAGGQYQSFPMTIRVIYIFTTLLILYQLFIFVQFQRKNLIAKIWVLKMFCLVGVLSIVVNLASRSTLERWNALPALLITLAFFSQLKKEKSWTIKTTIKLRVFEWLGVFTAILYSLLVAANIGAEFIGFTLVLASSAFIGIWAFLGKHKGILFLQFFYATAGIIGMIRWI